jgi:hypothetical protein
MKIRSGHPNIHGLAHLLDFKRQGFGEIADKIAVTGIENLYTVLEELL